MKKKIIRILKNRFTWVFIAGVLTASGVTVHPEILTAAGEVVISILENS